MAPRTPYAAGSCRAGGAVVTSKHSVSHGYNRADVPPTQSLIDLNAGRAALSAGAWQQAQEAFERGLAIEETPEAFEGLGLAAWWLDMAEVVFDSRERAYRGFRTRDDR